MKYEINFPTEPELGRKVTDRVGEVWERTGQSVSQWNCKNNYLRDVETWESLLKLYGPVSDYQEPIAKGIVQFADGGGEFNPSVRYEKDGVYRYVEYNPFHKWWQSSNAEELQADQRKWYT